MGHYPNVHILCIGLGLSLNTITNVISFSEKKKKKIHLTSKVLSIKHTQSLFKTLLLQSAALDVCLSKHLHHIEIAPTFKVFMRRPIYSSKGSPSSVACNKSGHSGYGIPTLACRHRILSRFLVCVGPQKCGM